MGYWHCPLSHKVLEDSHWDLRGGDVREGWTTGVCSSGL